MFPYRLLAVTISLASIILADSAVADVLVQPGYRQQFDSNPQYLQSFPQYQIYLPAKQYRSGQFPNQESTSYHSGVHTVQTVYPYDQNNARSHLIRYPHYGYHRHHHYLPRPNHHLHYEKIGGHEYVRPSVFLGYPQPLIVHSRYRRSRESEPTSVESSESANVAHDNDVAAKSSVTDAKSSTTAIDSLLPEHEPTDTNDKRVENRQSKDDHIEMMPRLLGLYPESLRYPDHRPSDNTNNIQQAHQKFPFNPSTSVEQSSAIVEPQQQTTVFPDNDQACISNEAVHLFTNRPSINLEQPLGESSNINDEYDDIYNKYRDAEAYQNEMTLSKMFESMQQNGMRYYWPEYYQQYVTNLAPKLKGTENQQRAAEEPEKKTLQDMTNIDVINIADPGQYKTRLSVPYFPKKLSAITDTPITAAEQLLQQPFVTYLSDRYRNKEKLSGTDEIDMPYFDMGILPSNYISYNSNNYPNYDSAYYSDDFWDNSNFCKKNLNSANYIEPSIKAPDSYVIYKNINTQSNLASMIPETQMQSLDTYAYSPKEKIQAISSGYYDNTYPSDTSNFINTFSSSVYY